MRLIDEVSEEKIRGGFYTPPSLVSMCLDRLLSLMSSTTDLALLEPSAGDGAFLRGLLNHPINEHISDIVAIEIDPEEASKIKELIDPKSRISLQVRIDDAIGNLIRNQTHYDAAVGNPPFVRFQYIDESVLLNLPYLEAELGFKLGRVGNLWIAVLLATLLRLKTGAPFAFVVPLELLSGVSAARVRAWLGRNCQSLRLDLFAPNSFPGVLQEIAILSGRISTSHGPSLTTLDITDNHSTDFRLQWQHTLSTSISPNWTKYLLAPKHLTVIEHATSLCSVRPLGSVATIEVSIVTGANDYFTVTDETLRLWQLEAWAKPLLARSRLASGLAFSPSDHRRLVESGQKSWLLDFDERLPDPKARNGPNDYIKLGEQEFIHKRFKTGIRTPWYRVPSVRRGTLMLSKRSHWYPRLLLNEAEAYTTDTIYRGNIKSGVALSPKQLVASFHSSLSMLFAEMEGRSFGGGVLELVPSEISRIPVVAAPVRPEEFDALDVLSRGNSLTDDSLIDATDLLVSSIVPEYDSAVIDVLRDAYLMLRSRRIARN